MGMKEWLQRIQPVPLHVILVLSVTFFLAQLVICHITHALTLLLDSYHMLCNIIALFGCIVTLKYDSDSKLQIVPSSEKNAEESSASISIGKSDTEATLQSTQEKASSIKRANDEKRLRNTFGWARIEVLTMLVVCVFFGSLCFSVILEAAQTLVHIGHMDAMHNPIVVFIMGFVGLCLNGFCYLLIGGYTFHQGSFIQVTSEGCVVLEGVVTASSVRQGQRRLSRSKRPAVLPNTKQREGYMEALRDVLSCFLVMVCAVIVYLVDPNIAKFIDPALAILSSFLLLFLTYPFMKESGMILLQTIPGPMNINLLKQELLSAFPSIMNVHDFHVWQLNSSKIIATVHIIFPTSVDYSKHCDDIKKFFMDEGIGQVTIQPEFSGSGSSMCDSAQSVPCLMTCIGKGCIDKHCCKLHKTPNEILSSVEVTVDKKERGSEKICIEKNVEEIDKTNKTNSKSDLNEITCEMKIVGETS